MNNAYKKIAIGLASDKKKHALAIGLVLLMALMWVRLLSKKGPAQAKAQDTNSATTEKNETQEYTFKPLEYAPERHDNLKRDFFRKIEPVKNDTRENPILTDALFKEKITSLTRLQAIVTGDNTQAFINEQLYEIESIFNLSDGTDVYQCKIIQIDAEYVVIECENKQIKIELTKENNTGK
jgi:hypothetical protein